VAVNVSARQFRAPTLIPTVAEALTAHGLEPRLLELEVTESVAMKDIDLAITTLRELKALGVFLSLDDFGTGYSSLSYLHQLPVHALKIDQSFVRRLPHSLESIATVKAIIALAHGLDRSLIAEGVETIAQLEFLKQHECEEAQGYLISKPLPAQEFATKFLMHQSAADRRSRAAGG
jgi:EAL domain-containing protein (putative c-di-GMP-specific phosphodiesterase class I)